MLKKLVFVLGVASIMMSCNQGADKLQTQVDSLKAELKASQEFASTLQEVGVLMDSIDANRQLLRVNMVEGTTYEDYTSRMKDINNYDSCVSSNKIVASNHLAYFREKICQDELLALIKSVK